MPRLAFAKGTRAERQQQRARIGRLQNAKVTAATLKKYHQYIWTFQQWVNHVGLYPAQTLEVLDKQLMEYIEWLWDQGFGKADAGYTLSGVQHALQVKRCFFGSWGLFRVWSRLELPVRAPPMPVRVAFGLAGACVAIDNCSMAILMIIAFAAMLRTTEFLTLRFSYLHFSSDLSKLVIVLPLTKSGQRKGTIEHVVIDDQPVVRLLYRLTEGRCDNAPIFQHSSQAFRLMFDQLLVELEISHLNLRLYSFRRGGATESFNHTHSMDSVLEKGRWSSPHTARIYLTAGLNELNSMRIQPRSEQLLQAFIARLII